MKLEKKGELLELTTVERGITRVQTFRVSDMSKVVHVKERGFCQVFVGGYDFQITPDAMNCKDSEKLNRKLRRLLKRPVFRWY